MEMSLSRFWIVGVGTLVGAIAGGWIWAQHVTTAAQVAASDNDDALIEAARSAGTAGLAAALQGAFVGGILGGIAVLLILYFTDPDRGMKVREVDTGDDRY